MNKRKKEKHLKSLVNTDIYFHQTNINKLCEISFLNLVTFLTPIINITIAEYY